MYERKFFVIISFFSLVLTFMSSSDIPSEYKILYAHLDGLLTRYDKELDSMYDSRRYDNFLPCAGLLAANSNSAGENYLRPKYLEFVKLYVDRLAELGCKAVQVDIQFPLFDDDYYEFAKRKKMMKSDFPEAKDFIAFYKKVSEYVKSKKLALLVESQVIFTQSTWSDLPVSGYYGYFEQLKEEGFKQYKSRKLKMLKLILKELKPDYLTFGDEPDTEMWLTGITLLKNKKNYLEMIRHYADELSDVKEEAKLGTGYGIWDENWKYWNEC